MSNVKDIIPNGLVYARLEGVISGDCLAGQTTILSWTVPYERILNGADYCLDVYQHGDKLSFEIHHPQIGLVNQFAKDIYVRKEYRKELYGALLPAGLIVKVIYENNGASDVNINVNLDLHESA